MVLCFPSPSCNVLYMSKRKEEKMTTIKLTDKQIQALCYALNLAELEYTEKFDHLYTAMDQVRVKLENSLEPSTITGR